MRVLNCVLVALIVSCASLNWVKASDVGLPPYLWSIGPCGNAVPNTKIVGKRFLSDRVSKLLQLYNQDAMAILNHDQFDAWGSGTFRNESNHPLNLYLDQSPIKNEIPYQFEWLDPPNAVDQWGAYPCIDQENPTPFLTPNGSIRMEGGDPPHSPVSPRIQTTLVASIGATIVSSDESNARYCSNIQNETKDECFIPAVGISPPAPSNDSRSITTNCSGHICYGF